MKSNVPAWRKTVTLPLPGDADSVLDFEIQRAIRRDGRLNWLEHVARTTGEVCSFCTRRYVDWHCSYRYPGLKCFYCKELDD